MVLLHLLLIFRRVFWLQNLNVKLIRQKVAEVAVLEGVHSLKRKLRIEIQLAGPVKPFLVGTVLV